MRLGFSVRVLGQRGLRAYDTRRPHSAPHLSVSLAHLRDVFAYLAKINVQFYRMSAELAPYNTHPAHPQLHRQIEECTAELAAIGALARHYALRLTFHAPLHVQLAAEDPIIAQQSFQTLEVLAALLDGMVLDADAVIVVHVGGIYGAVDATVGRWAARWDELSDVIRRRLVLEHDDSGPSLGLALRIHAATGVPIVFDQLHFCLNNPEGWSLAEGLAVALATWPYDRTPKVHFSSPRTELRVVERVDPVSGRQRWALSPPRPGHHADFLNPWEFSTLLQAAKGARDFDIMLEAKAADLALLRLRQDLRTYLPDLARSIGLQEVHP